MERKVSPTEENGGGRLSRWQAHSLLYAGLSGVAYAVSYAFYAVLSRNLPLAEFGLAGVYIAFLGVASLVSGALILAVGREVSSKGTPSAAAAVRAAGLKPLRKLAILFAVAGAAALPFAVEPALVLFSIALIPLRDLHCGLLSGLRLNLKFGSVLLAEAGVRFAGSFATIWVPSAQVALAAWLLSYAAGLGLAIALLPRHARLPTQPLPFAAGLREAVLIRLPQVCFLNIDVILLPAVIGVRPEVGVYVGAAILSRVPFYLVTAHAIGEWPNLVKEQGRGPAAGRVVLLGALGAGALVTGLWAVPELALGLAFGPGYAAGGQVLLVLGLTGFLLVQVNSAAYILIAAGRGMKAAGVMGIGAIGEVALIFLLGGAGGAGAVADATAFAAGGSLFGLIAFQLVGARLKKEPMARSTAREGSGD